MNGTSSLFFLLFIVLALPNGQPSKRHISIQLIDVAEASGVSLLNISSGPQKDYLLDIAGNGAAFFDYDNDGDMDLLLTNGSTFDSYQQGGDPMTALYQNDGEGNFSVVTSQSNLTAKGWAMGVCAADYDNDGHQDIYVTAYGPNRLFRNLGDGTFADVTEPAGVGEPRWGTNCAFGDYDRDGNVDLYVANYVIMDRKTTPTRGVTSFRGVTSDCRYMGMDVLCGPRPLPGESDVLYHNNGDGTFADVTRAAGIQDPGYYGLGVIFFDFDKDGWPDIYVANDSTPNFLFRNNHDGTFSEIAIPAGVAFSEDGHGQAGMGVDVGDYDNDGHFDIFVTNFSHDTSTLYQNNGDGVFNVVTSRAGLAHTTFPYLGWGTGFVDLDNDGYLDLFVANGHIYPEVDRFPLETFHQQNQLFHNLGNGRFHEVSGEVGTALLSKKSSRGVAFGDYDNDGDLDLVVINLDDRPTLLRNEGGNKDHWLTLQLVGTDSNKDAIGTYVTVDVGGITQTGEVRSGGSYLSHNDMRVHFGLGKETTVQEMRIRWPSGRVDTFENVPGDRFLRIVEGEGLTTYLNPAE
jgi:hypothetical protein